MPLTFEVCRTREADATVSVDSNKVDSKEKRSWTVNYRVIAQGIDDPYEVSEISAMRANGVPLLKNSVYVDPNGTIFPYFACVSKNSTRNPSNPYVFDIVCEYTDDTGEDGEEVQPTPEDYTASIKWTVKSRQRSSWTDVDGNPYVLPSGSKFKQGLKLDYACLVATVTQLESDFTVSKLKDRMLKTNTSAYNGIRANAALITDIQYETVQVPVGALGVITGYVTAQRVQYTIEENTLSVKGGVGDGDPQQQVGAGNVKTYKVDWRQARPMIDSIVKNMTTQKFVAANLLGPAVTNVYLDNQGRLLHSPNLPNFGTALPALKLFNVYDETSFSFLRK